MNISIKVINNGTEFIANCPELDINCYGSDKNEAIRRIKEVIHFYITSAKEMGVDILPFKDLSLEGAKNFVTSFATTETKNTIN